MQGAGVGERTMTDARTAEQGGLGEKVVSGEMSAAEAAAKVRTERREQAQAGQDGAEPRMRTREAASGGEKPQSDAEKVDGRPKAPTPLQRAQDEIAKLKDVVEAKTARISELEEQVETLEEQLAVAQEGQQDGPAREAKLSAIQQDRDSWRRKAEQWNIKHNDRAKEVTGLKREVARLDKRVTKLQDHITEELGEDLPS